MILKSFSLSVLLVCLFTASAWAQPAMVVLTDSKQQAMQTMAGKVKHWLGKLRQANQFEDFQLPVTSIDLANPAIAADWQKRFGVSKADLPALGYVVKQGNKITELGLLVGKYQDPVKAAQTAFKFAQSKDSTIKIAEVQTLLSVTSEPGGAAVLIGGEEVGVTPAIEVPVPAGQMTVEVRHPDCQVWSSPVNVKIGDLQTVAATLTVLPGNLRVVSSTPVKVYLDGESAAQSTPLALENLNPGPRSLRIVGPNGEDLNLPLRISGGKTTLVEIPEMRAPTRRVASVIGSAKGTHQVRTDMMGATTELNVELDAAEINAAASAALSAATNSMEPVSGESQWDYACQWSFTAGAQAGSVKGSVVVIDATGRTVATFEGKRGMPLISFNYSAAAQAKAKEIVADIVPQIVEKLLDQPAPKGAAVVPKVTIVAN